MSRKSVSNQLNHLNDRSTKLRKEIEDSSTSEFDGFGIGVKVTNISFEYEKLIKHVIGDKR